MFVYIGKNPRFMACLDSNLHTQLAIVTENELGLAFPHRNLPKKFRPDLSTFYLVIVVTNRQTNAGDSIIPHFRGDNHTYFNNPCRKQTFITVKTSPFRCPAGAQQKQTTPLRATWGRRCCDLSTVVPALRDLARRQAASQEDMWTGSMQDYSYTTVHSTSKHSTISPLSIYYPKDVFYLC